MLVLKSCFLCVINVSVSSSLCSVLQWEALKSTVVGTNGEGFPEVILTDTQISYDFNNSRIAETSYKTEDGQRVEVKKIYNYGQKIQYAIKGGSCSKYKLDEPFRKQCVPQNLTLIMPVVYGLGDMQTRLFVYEFRGMQDGFNYIVQTSWSGNPVFEQIYGVAMGASMFFNTAYLNMTWGIKNPDVFTPPPSCNGLNIQINQDTIPKGFGLTF